MLYILTAPNSWCLSHLYLARVIAPAETPAGVFIECSDAADDKLQNQATTDIISDPHCCLLQTLALLLNIPLHMLLAGHAVCMFLICYWWHEMKHKLLWINDSLMYS